MMLGSGRRDYILQEKYISSHQHPLFKISVMYLGRKNMASWNFLHLGTCTTVFGTKLKFVT